MENHGNNDTASAAVEHTSNLPWVLEDWRRFSCHRSY